MPTGPQFWQSVCGLLPNSLADLVHFWQVTNIKNGTPDSKEGPDPPHRGFVGPEIFVQPDI